jgi:hypothetical protein
VLTRCLAAILESPSCHFSNMKPSGMGMRIFFCNVSPISRIFATDRVVNDDCAQLDPLRQVAQPATGYVAETCELSLVLAVCSPY